MDSVGDRSVFAVVVSKSLCASVPCDGHSHSLAGGVCYNRRTQMLEIFELFACPFDLPARSRLVSIIMEISMDGCFSLLQFARYRAWRTCVALGALVIAGSVQVCVADDPVSVVQAESGTRTAEIQAWIEQLAAPSFSQREEASRQLLSIGEPAIELLRAAKSHSSIEVSDRAARIYTEIEKQVFESVTKHFLLQSDGSQGYGLPAWSQFREIAGDSRSSKLLFVTMLRSQRELATFVEAGKDAQSIERLSKRAIQEAERLRAGAYQNRFPASRTPLLLCWRHRCSRTRHPSKSMM